MTSTARPAKPSSNGRRSFRASTVLPALAFVAFMPAAVFAQSGIAGVVRDASGAVLPGVTVEAASPALIEKVRAVVADGAGRYNIVDLRPGTYTVTFTLPGFTTVVRGGIVLPSAFTATVNAELKVAGVEETVTVSAEAPVVDIQNVERQNVLSRELLEGIPTGGLVQQFAQLIPSVTAPGTHNTFVHNSYVQSELYFRGERSSQFRVNGFDLSHELSDTTQYSINQGIVQDLLVSAGSAGAEQLAGGVITNVVPREGGNTLRGQVYFHYGNESTAGDNTNAEMEALGVRSQSIREQWDINPAIGGAIVQDRLWFFGSFRHSGSDVNAGVRFDADPLDWVYTPDFSRKTASERTTDKNYTIHLTWQATPRNKINGYFDDQPKNAYNRNISGSTSPEASRWGRYFPTYNGQLNWRSPVNNRLLLEGAMSYFRQTYNPAANAREATFDGPASPDLNAVTAFEQTLGIRFRAPTNVGTFNLSKMLQTRLSASYVTGTHTLKVGLQHTQGSLFRELRRNQDYGVRVRNGVPNRVELRGIERLTNQMDPALALYAQDRWTIDRMTINAGLRYDYMHTSIPAQEVPASRFVPATRFDAVDRVLAWHDLSPRLGVAYDLFGTGRTVFKATFNKYLTLEGIDAGNRTGHFNPVLSSVIQANRSWNDRNGDFIPDCNFDDPGANGECGPLDDLNFGQQVPSAVTFNPDLLTGFGKRPYDWETTAALQHELIPGLAVDLTYARRAWANLTAADNLEVAPADFDEYCITVPRHPRIPGGGGNQLCGFYDIKPEKFGQRTDYVTFASDFGDPKRVYNGVDLNFTARLPNGIRFTGGTSTGRLAINNCFVIDTPATPPPNSIATGGTGSGEFSLDPSNANFCENKPPFLTQLKFMAVYPTPWWGLQFNAAFQRVSGPEISNVTVVVPTSEIRASLGRDLSAGPSSQVELPIMAPGTAFADHWHKLDLRLSKNFRFGARNLVASLDIFNALNGAGVVNHRAAYGPRWLDPTAILGARFFRFSGQVDF